MRFVTKCVLVWLVVIPVATDADSGAIMSVGSGERDLGEVHYGDTASATVPVKNTGQGLLEITRLRSTCGCTTARISQKQLKPGEQAELTISFDAKGIEPGRKTQSVFVHSNDAQNPVAAIRTFVTVVQQVRVEPSQIVTRIDGFQEQLSFPMKVINAWDQAVMLDVSSARGAVERAHIEPNPFTVAPGKTAPFTLHAQLHGPPDSNFFRGAILFKTNHPKEDVIVVNVLVRTR